MRHGRRGVGTSALAGFALGDKESEASWRAFFLSLKVRGLTGVDLVVSDDHAGLVKAVQSSFAGSSRQRSPFPSGGYPAHFLRNLSDACPKAGVEAFLASARQVLRAPDPASARARLRETCAAFELRCSKAVSLLESAFSAFEEVTSVLALPSKYHRLLRTTNSQERLNQEIGRRDRVIRIYPSRASCERLLGALLMEFDEAMSCGKVYLDMSEYLTWRDAQRACRDAGLVSAGSAAVFGGKEGEVLLAAAWVRGSRLFGIGSPPCPHNAGTI